jgi:uncharacterized protein
MKLIFKDILELSQTEYFYLDESGQLRLKPKFGGRTIDIHTHIGFNYFLSRRINQNRVCRVEHYFPAQGVPIHLNRNSVDDYSPSQMRITFHENVKAMVTTRGIHSTHTAANLFREMERMGINRSVILPIDLVTSHNTRNVLRACHQYGDALIPFGSIHPLAPLKKIRLVRQIRKGIRGLKIQSAIQMIRPSHPETIRLCRLAGEFHLPVLIHCGTSPVSPKWHARYTRMPDYRILIEHCPETTFILAHAGYAEYRQVAQIGKSNPNIYIDISTQPPGAIRYLVETVGPDRILFASDWPYYPIALPLYKTLVATADNARLRAKILYENAAGLLHLPK